jgi:hypothetical protein
MEFGVWRIDSALQALRSNPPGERAHPKDVLDQGISLAA